MVILSSPSGAGKTTLVNLFLQKIILRFQYLIQLANLAIKRYIIKIITLLMMKNSKDLIKNEEFLEYAKVFNNFMEQQEVL